MTLQCECGSYALEITSQSYAENGNGFESYKCDHCGRTGTLTHNAATNRTTLDGALGSDGL